MFYVGFDINGFEIGLDPDLENVKEGNNSVAYWKVDNIEIAINKLQANGATIEKDINDVGGGMKVATIKDPFGNSIGLIEEAQNILFRNESLIKSNLIFYVSLSIAQYSFS